MTLSFGSEPTTESCSASNNQLKLTASDLGFNSTNNVINNHAYQALFAELFKFLCKN